MMSTTGRIPVIAAPTPIPEMPASATSSPIKKTRWSRRISSASASLTASAKVRSRTAVPSTAFSARLGVDMSVHLRRVGVGSIEREALALLDLCGHAFVEGLEVVLGRVTAFANPDSEQLQRVARRPPLLLLLLRAVVGAIDVADMVPEEPVRPALQERGALT